MPARLTFGRRSADAEAISLRSGPHNSNSKNSHHHHIVDYTKVQDLADLEEITLENVLRCLMVRYMAGQFYTFAGSVLISLNPIASLGRRSLPNFDNLDLFRNLDNNVEGEKSCPSVISVGEKCVRRLSNIGNDQVVVVSGDSGAGKTTVTQELLCYIIDKSCRTVTPNSLDKKIYFATRILESLGNASTTANLNSSRFGRFIQLKYDGGPAGSLIGARIRTCLLEKHRVSKFEKTERNFHIFYYIFSGLKSGALKVSDILNENVTGCSSWENTTPIYFLDGMAEADKLQFQSLLYAFQALKLTQEFRIVFRVIYGIMMLINVPFVPMQEEEDSSSSQSQEYCEYVPEDEEFMRGIGELFSVDPKILSNILVSRTITVRGGCGKRQSIFRKPCGNASECEARKFVIASAFYDTLFGYILRRLNFLFKMNPENDSICYSMDAGKLKTISLLDLYGFENLATNGLEQLCINYANERLHFVHVQNMKLYACELENFAPTELIKIEGETLRRLKSIHETIFTALDEACLLNRKVSEVDTYQRITNLTARDQFVQARSVHHSNCQFVIKHYAAEVKYSFTGMVDKNSDNVPPEFRELFASSTNPSIRLLFSDVGEGVPDHGKTPKGGNKREKTILQRFKASVDELATELSNEGQDVHFIRCIRPSDKTGISADVVKRQLFSSGLVDIIRITGDRFPIRLLQSKFESMFPAILNRFLPMGSGYIGLAISKVFGMSEEEFRIGQKQFFLTEEAFAFLKKLESFLLRRNVTRIQKYWNLWQTRKIVTNPKNHTSGSKSSLLEEKSVHVESGAGDVCLGTVAFSQDFREINPSGNQLHIHGDTESPRVRKIDSGPERKSLCSLQLVQVLGKTSEDEMHCIIENLNLRRRCGILTRGQLFQFPVRFHTRKTLLPFSHCFPKSQGLNELLK